METMRGYAAIFTRQTHGISWLKTSQNRVWIQEPMMMDDDGCAFQSLILSFIGASFLQLGGVLSMESLGAREGFNAAVGYMGVRIEIS